MMMRSPCSPRPATAPCATHFHCWIRQSRRATAASARTPSGSWSELRSGVLEEIMQAVSGSASHEILQTTDRLLSEGQNPVYFAKQLVRFLRNAIVAKVAGTDSSLLQISSDERARVARVAELFSEEDLARHLQIMLRTHAELGYRQEQRFHLELGLLKMAHAQRLLPLEQLLSGVEVPPVTDRKLAAVPEPKKASDNSAAAKPFVSPFAADSARKGT